MSSNMTARMYFEQGRHHFARREFDNAADHFQQAVNADPMYHDAHRYLAETFERLGYRHRARKAWEGLQRITQDSEQQTEIAKRLENLA